MRQAWCFRPFSFSKLLRIDQHEKNFYAPCLKSACVGVFGVMVFAQRIYILGRSWVIRLLQTTTSLSILSKSIRVKVHVPKTEPYDNGASFVRFPSSSSGWLLYHEEYLCPLHIKTAYVGVSGHWRLGPRAKEYIFPPPQLFFFVQLLSNSYDQNGSIWTICAEHWTRVSSFTYIRYSSSRSRTKADMSSAFVHFSKQWMRGLLVGVGTQFNK